MLRITTVSTRRVASGRLIHRGGVVRGAGTFQLLEQRDGGKTEADSAPKSAPRKVSQPTEQPSKECSASDLVLSFALCGVSSSNLPVVTCAAHDDVALGPSTSVLQCVCGCGRELDA